MIADEKDVGAGGRGFFSPHVPPPSHLLAQRIHVFTTGHTLHSHRKWHPHAANSPMIKDDWSSVWLFRLENFTEKNISWHAYFYAIFQYKATFKHGIF